MTIPSLLTLCCAALALTLSPCRGEAPKSVNDQSTGTKAQAPSRIASPVPEEIAPGIWKLHFGEPDAYTPCQVRVAEMKGADSFAKLAPANEPPFDLKAIRCRITPVRTVLSIPCGNKVGDFFGFGLDPDCYRQNGLIKRPQVCDSSEGEPLKKRGPGSSHAPVPLYFSTAGYGVYVDTARVAEFQMARLGYNKQAGLITDQEKEREMLTLEGLYAQQSKGKEVLVDIPGAKGIDIYVFAGPDVRTAVQRWNLFSGGGAVPPLWGCGVQLRTFNGGDAAMMDRICDDLRSKQIPCDMLGLEPKWQSHAYPCSFSWSPERFPDPAAFIAGIKSKGFKLNLWEHSYIDTTAPFYKEIQPFTGSVLAMGGLVLDPLQHEGVRIYQGYHERELIAKGVSGFKVDECDRATIRKAQGFSFPNLTEFPSGIDGEQMGQTYGYLLQKNMLASFRKFNQRTFGNVRASGALASSLPFVLYSDTYTLTDYIRQSCNASFSGLLWSPEFRDAPNMHEFQRRMAVVSFSHLFLLNPYFNRLPLWENYKVSYGNKDPKPLPPEEQAQAEVVLRHYGNLRMQFVPYLYAAYCDYGKTGMPPIRALVLDFPNDPKVREIDDSYMFGPSLLVAPFLLEHKESRQVYLPAGCDWYDFSTGERHKGGETVTVKATLDGEKIENIPLFVRADTLLPVAEPVPFVASDTVFKITVRAYGDNPKPCTLFEDDGMSYDFEKGVQNRVTLSLKDGKITVSREGGYKGKRYEIAPTPQK